MLDEAATIGALEMALQHTAGGLSRVRPGDNAKLIAWRAESHIKKAQWLNYLQRRYREQPPPTDPAPRGSSGTVAEMLQRRPGQQPHRDVPLSVPLDQVIWELRAWSIQSGVPLDVGEAEPHGVAARQRLRDLYGQLIWSG